MKNDKTNKKGKPTLFYLFHVIRRPDKYLHI